jgi:uncharacterized protein YidB (DUF937 family)
VRMVRWGLGVVSLGAAAMIAVAALGFGGASAQTSPEEAPKRGERYQELLAEQLGISVEELEAAQTSARDQLIDELLEAGDITEEQAERLKEREFGQGHPGFWLGVGAGGRIHNAVVEVFETAAEVVGVPAEDLRDRIAGGESLVEIAEAQGIDEETLKTDLIAALTDKINQAVADGDIEQEMADRLLENLEDMVERAINAEGPFPRTDGPRPGRFFERFMP